MKKVDGEGDNMKHMKRIYSMLHPEDYLESAMDYIEEYDEPEMLDKVDELADQLMHDDWENFYYPVLENYFKKHICIATGSIGRWDGALYGASVIESFRDFMDLLEDCWYIELFDNNGYLTVCGHHHDGDVLFTIRELNGNGINWYMEHKWTTDNVRYLDTNFCSGRPQIDWCL